jgi:hypothetical protein
LSSAQIGRIVPIMKKVLLSKNRDVELKMPSSIATQCKLADAIEITSRLFASYCRRRSISLRLFTV